MAMQKEPLKVSYILLTYNQEAYVAAALRSALDQSYRPMELLISDDASTDATATVIEEILLKVADPTLTIRFFQNKVNQGLIVHLNQVLERSTGDVFVLAAGDDVSKPYRVERLVACYLDQGRPLLIHSKAHAMDEHGNLLSHEEPPPSLRRAMSATESAVAKNIYLGATAMWSRELTDIFGPITELQAFEDIVAGFRAALAGHVEYLDEALVCYRVGVGLSQGRPDSYPDFLRRRKRGLQVSVATLRQRLNDVSDPRFYSIELVKLIQRRLFSESVRLGLYDDEKDPTPSGGLGKILAFYFRCSEKLKRLEAFLKFKKSGKR
jgi:glycosyltransferase involved in cell wall biosynthesis